MSGEVAHSLTGASGMERWENCPGSIRLSRDLPKPPPSAAAALGTYVHGLCEKVLKLPLKDRAAELELIEATETKEIFEAVKIYVNLIMSERPFTSIQWVEKHFDLSDTVYRGCYGTSDAVHYYPKQKLLRVYDYKNGKKTVLPENNRQLLYYALGAYLSILEMGQGLEVKNIELVVCQPNAPRKGEVIHRWKFPALDIWDFALQLMAAVKRTEDPNAPLVPGDYCYFCPAVLSCPAKLEARQEKAAAEFAEFAQQ